MIHTRATTTPLDNERAGMRFGGGMASQRPALSSEQDRGAARRLSALPPSSDCNAPAYALCAAPAPLTSNRVHAEPRSLASRLRIAVLL